MIKLIGHRGNGRTTDTPFAAGKAPQHTLASFAQAIENGAEGVEFDVFLTRDRVPVVVDQNIVMGHTISDLDCADVQGIAVSQGQTIPTLEQTLILLTGFSQGRAGADPLFINVELKGPDVVKPTMDVVDGVARHYGMDKGQVYYSATDRNKLDEVRAADRDAHIQTTILTNQLFDPSHVAQPGYHVNPRTAYNRAALGDLARYIRKVGCCAIDTPTADIRAPLIELADRLGVGFCTHPTGPRRSTVARDMLNTVRLLEEFSRNTHKHVVMKVDDINAARRVIRAANTHRRVPVRAIERMMGVHFLPAA